MKTVLHFLLGAGILAWVYYMFLVLSVLIFEPLYDIPRTTWFETYILAPIGTLAVVVGLSAVAFLLVGGLIFGAIKIGKALMGDD